MWPWRVYPSQDGKWSQWHYIFAGLSPVSMALLLLTATKGWEGYTMFAGSIPLVALLAILGKQEYASGMLLHLKVTV